MVNDNPFQKGLQRSIDCIGENFCVDPESREDREVAGKEVRHWSTTLLALSYVLDQSALIVGEPGFAKTTAAKAISSVLSGYPFDLYEAAQIQGHPDQTFETMIARLDFSRLQREEKVIWLSSAYLPVCIVDEMNRLPAGKQTELLTAIETGRWNYLNATFFKGKVPFIATANHPDDGNHIMIHPLRDRFSIHLELGYIGVTYEKDVRNAQDSIKELCDNALTTRILDIINSSEKSVQDKLGEIDTVRKSFVKKIGTDIDAYVVDNTAKKTMQEQIAAIPETTEAMVFRQMITAELSTTPTYGRKRSNDPVDTSNHAKELASTACANSLSYRGSRSLCDYAKALAWLTADDPAKAEVTKEHIATIAPHVLGHRLEFTQDYRAQYEGKQRPGMYGMTMGMFLSEQLVAGIGQRYKPLKETLDLLVTAQQRKDSLSSEQQREVAEMLAARERMDHPLLREYVSRLKNRR